MLYEEIFIVRRVKWSIVSADRILLKKNALLSILYIGYTKVQNDMVQSANQNSLKCQNDTLEDSLYSERTIKRKTVLIKLPLK